MGGGQFKLYVFLSHSKNNLAMNKDKDEKSLFFDGCIGNDT